MSARGLAQFRADASGATESSAVEEALLAGVTRRLVLLGAFTGLKTGGYQLVGVTATVDYVVQRIANGGLQYNLSH